MNSEFILKIHPIPGDGNCLFSALVHQLTGLHHSHDLHQEAIRVMRQECVNYIQSSIDTYRELIITEALERGQLWPDDTDGITHDRIIVDYLEELRKNGVWAGSEVLAAVRDKLGVTIRVFADHFNPLIFEGNNNNETINVFYNGVNHYDSVIDIREAMDRNTIGVQGQSEQEQDYPISFQQVLDKSGVPILKFFVSPVLTNSLFFAIVHQTLKSIENRDEVKKKLQTIENLAKEYITMNKEILKSRTIAAYNSISQIHLVLSDLENLIAVTNTCRMKVKVFDAD